MAFELCETRDAAMIDGRMQSKKKKLREKGELENESIVNMDVEMQYTEMTQAITATATRQRSDKDRWPRTDE